MCCDDLQLSCTHVLMYTFSRRASVANETHMTTQELIWVCVLCLTAFHIQLILALQQVLKAATHGSQYGWMHQLWSSHCVHLMQAEGCGHLLNLGKTGVLM